MARVVVLGGGLGGVVAGRQLRKRLPAQHQVTIIERQPRLSFPPSYLWVMTGDRRPERITRDLRRLERKGIQVLATTVTGIDVEAQQVQTEDGAEAYDYLVVALGAELAPDLVPGLAEAGHNLYQLDGAVGLRDALRRFTSGTLAIVVAALPYKCPAAPYEAALLVESACRARAIRERVRIQLFVPEAAPLPVAGPLVGSQVRRLLHQRGIDFHPQSHLRAADAAGRRLTLQDGEERPYDLLAYVPPHRPPATLRATAMVNDAGWAIADPATLETRIPNHFAIGDATAMPLANGMPLPKAGTFAHAQAEAVARTIAHRVTGRGRPGRFGGHGACFLEVGDGRAGYAAGNFYGQDGEAVSLRGPSRRWHWAKVWFERYWLWRWY